MRKLKLNELGRIGAEEFKNKTKTPIIVVLDNIRSAMNVGSFFRLADGLAIEKICICGISAVPPHREISKTAIGAENSVYWIYFEDVVKCIELIKSEGYTIVGIEQTDLSESLENLIIDSSNKYCLIFGNEVDGLSVDILPLLDKAVEIPQFGTKHSFNVSTAGAIVIWEFIRQLNFINK